MARKPPAAYAGAELAPVTPAAPVSQPAAPEEAAAPAQPVPARRGRPAAARTLKEASAPVMLYLDPAALKALKRYALDQNTKVHSLLLEAVEAWFKAHGLRENVRAQTGRQDGR